MKFVHVYLHSPQTFPPLCQSLCWICCPADRPHQPRGSRTEVFRAERRQCKRSSHPLCAERCSQNLHRGQKEVSRRVHINYKQQSKRCVIVFQLEILKKEKVSMWTFCSFCLGCTLWWSRSNSCSSRWINGHGDMKHWLYPGSRCGVTEPFS